MNIDTSMVFLLRKECEGKWSDRNLKTLDIFIIFYRQNASTGLETKQR